MKTLALIVVGLLASFHYSEAFFLCYNQDVGGPKSVVFCMKSCFSAGVSVAGVSGVRKGCADKLYESTCKAAGLPGFLSGVLSGHSCFCNLPLCNASSVPSVFLPLLLTPYLLQKLI